MALLEFYGEECPHCQTMMAIIDRLVSEGFPIERLETWHNQANAERLMDVDHGSCGGVPLFVNTDSGKILCGEQDYEALRSWAEGK